MSKRIHITSSGPRTGSTLLTEVFKSCFDIDCSCDHEAPLAKSNSSFGNCDKILTKLPSSTQNLDVVLKFTTNIYIICIIRDPRDMVVSKHGRFPDLYYCGLDYWFNFLKDINKLKDHPRFFIIKYEDFTRNPNLVQEKIKKKFDFLNSKHKFSDYHKHITPGKDSLLALKSFRPIESKGVGNWKNHLTRIKQQTNKHGSLTKSLMQFGYEKDDEWTQLLRDIPLKEFKSYKKENTHRKKNYQVLLLTLFNFFCENISLNPDRISKPLKRIL